MTHLAERTPFPAPAVRRDTGQQLLDEAVLLIDAALTGDVDAQWRDRASDFLLAR